MKSAPDSEPNDLNIPAGSDAKAAIGTGRPGSGRPLAFSLFKPGRRTWWFALFLVAITFIAYLPALNGGFVWDDDSWTTKIIGLLHDASGLRRMWFQPTALQQYYPLSGTSFWLDYHLWKLWTTPYHVENILLHALAALLFWRLLLRLRVPGAGLAGAIFALHPVMVQSVAWITERKNVLSLVFYLGAFLAYERYAPWVTNAEETAPAPDSSRDRRHPRLFYGLAFVLFLCALLAKTETFSLPAAILLVCWWKRGQIRGRADVLPTLPFFALALGLCALTAWLEKNHVGAEGADFALTFPQRCLVAGHAFWFYLGKLFWPANLCFVYPRWQPNPGSWWSWLYPATAVGGLFTLWLGRGRIGRGPVTALFFYVGTLFPLLGFMNAYGMRYSFVWNQWAYISSLGIIALVAALVMRTVELLRTPVAIYGFAAILLPVLALLTWRQAGTYTDKETLWRDTLAKNPDCWLAYNNLGGLLIESGQLKQATRNFRQAIQANPNYIPALENLGFVLAKQGQFDEAIENFRKVSRLRPEYPQNFVRLGMALEQSGHTAEAIAQYREALRLNPDLTEALNNLAWLLATSPDARFRNGPEAVSLAERACELTRHRAPLLMGTLAAAYAESGRFPEAVSTAEAAEQFATRAGLKKLAAKNRQLLELYRAGKPYHEPAPKQQ